MKTGQLRIEATDTVNDVLARYPATISVFNQFGIDSCCGGSVPLTVAAQRDGTDVVELIARLNAVIDDR